MRRSRRRFLTFWFRLSVVMMSVSSSASRYHIVVRWGLPSAFNVPTTPTWSSLINSLAQSESVLVIVTPFFSHLCDQQPFCWCLDTLRPLKLAQGLPYF